MPTPPGRLGAKGDQMRRCTWSSGSPLQGPGVRGAAM